MIAITGAAGFIGSCFVKYLNEQGVFDIIVVDTLGTGDKWKNVVTKQYSLFLTPGQFLEQFATGALPEVKTIVHLGALTSTTEKDADRLLRENYEYSRQLALSAASRGVRFLYASSAATYGSGDLGYRDDRVLGLRPLNMYGYSKQMFDEWVVQSADSLNYVGLKFFNVFGPNEYHKNEMASMVYKSFLQVKNLGSVNLFKSNDTIYGNGEQQRDFIYVKDCCRAMYAICSDPRIKGIYNLGTGKARTWNDLVTAVFVSLGQPVDIRYVPMPESLVGQYQNFTEAEMSKLHSEIPGFTFMELEDSVRDYIQVHLNTLQPYW